MNRWQILSFAVLCGVLRELFDPRHLTVAGHSARIFIATAGFALAGFFVSELNRKHQQVVLHLTQLEEQIRLRQDAEQQLRVLVQTSPLAILTLNRAGNILIANGSAQELLGFVGRQLQSREIHRYLPNIEPVPQRAIRHHESADNGGKYGTTGRWRGFSGAHLVVYV